MTLAAHITLFFATALVLHAAYSTYEHQSLLKALGRPEGAIPIDIVIEAMFGMFLGILGASLNAPVLKEITWASEMKKRTIDDMDSRLSFASYETRARGITTTSKEIH